MIRIGSRGSQLALWQSNHIADALRALGHQVSIEIIRTTGDRLQDIAFAKVGSKGMFTREIEDALLSHTIDIAVHSLKDLPTVIGDEFALAAVPARVDARDAFVSIRHGAFADLPPSAVVGTSSVRRQALLRSVRPDLDCIEFRGNVDTRLRKLSEGRADAIVLAAAGLERLGRTEWLRERFPPEVLCPAPGQGALAIECRSNDAVTLQAMRRLDDPATRLAVAEERALLAALGGGCQVPIGAYCSHDGREYHMRAVIASPDGKQVLSVKAKQPQPQGLGDALAQRLLEQGANELLGLEAGT